MDNRSDGGSDDDVGQQYPLRYAPKPLAVIVCWVGAVVGAGWAVLANDAPGRFLAVVATGMLLIVAIRWTAIRPRLAAGPDGVLVGALGAARAWPWSAVRRVEVVATNRLGRNVGMLELDLVADDGSERLVVLTMLDLGVDPWLVEQDLAEVRR